MKIAIGGMIAVGKSTLVESLGKELNIPVMEEFEADDEVFHTLLKWLYEGKPDVEMLLQIYFIHNHYQNQQKYGNDFIVDRDITEHWIFAKNNLWKYPEVMNMYNGIFMAYLNQITLPNLYIILDASWETFLKRIEERGRAAEIDNLEENIEYFKGLHSTYLNKLTAQCEIYDIPYVVINVDGKTRDEVLAAALEEIEKFK